VHPRRKALLVALRDPDPAVRSAASESLDRVDVLEALPEVLGRLPSLGKVEWVRLLRSMKGVRDETCLKLAIRGLEHEDEDVRLAAFDLVEAFCDWRATPHLTRALGDPNPLVRARAAAVLGRLGDRRAAQSLSGLLADPDPRVVAEAAGALGLLGHAPSEAGLIALVEHPDEELRVAAVMSLGRIGIT
jgi:HEAT repeat protein